MTPTEVEDRFEEAALTLKRLPNVRVPGYFNTWPEIVRSFAEAYGWEGAGRPVRIVPTAQAISRMEETFEWLTWLSGDDAKVVWLRAERIPWKQICYRIGVSRPTAWRRWAAALITISQRLSAPPSMPVARPKSVRAAGLRR